MMDANNIRISFLPLRQQQFEFQVYRLKCADQSEKPSDDCYQFSLPDDALTDGTRSDYWVSFEERDELLPYVCNSSSNNYLTVHYLFSLLLLRAQRNIDSRDYAVEPQQFRRRIEFVLHGHHEGDEVIWLEPFFLRATQQFGFLLDFHFNKKEEIPFSRKIQVLSLSLDRDYRANKNHYIDRYGKVKSFLQTIAPRLSPLREGTDLLEIADSFSSLPSKRLHPKVYIFGNDKSAQSTFKGLQNYGPYRPVKAPVRFACIYRKSEQALIYDLAAALAGKLPSVPFRGMAHTFGLRYDTPTGMFPVSDYSAESLERLATQLSELKTSIPNTRLFPIVIIGNDAETDYNHLKAMCLDLKLPLQVVTCDLVHNKQAFKWSVSNIALQSFAKLGGIPWKVKPTNDKTIIFGIGQAHEFRDGVVIKYYSYSVCTDSSGLYRRLDVLGSASDQPSYLKQLKDAVVEMLAAEVNANTATCVFHVHFKLRRHELKAINEAIDEARSERGMSEVDFIVLKINRKSKYFGYAPTNSLIPYEGSFARLSRSPSEYLLWLDGLGDGSSAIDRRFGRPLHVEFHWSSRALSDSEQERHLQDLLNLTGANWRAFKTSNVPISTLYCELISDFVRRFRGESELIDNVQDPWFL